MKLPRRLKLLGRSVPLKTYPGAVHIDESTDPPKYRSVGSSERNSLEDWGWAYCRYGNGYSIHLGLDGPDLGASLLHEVGHLLMDLTGVDKLLDRDESEAVAQAFATGMASLIRDNSALVDFIRDSEQYRSRPG